MTSVAKDRILIRHQSFQQILTQNHKNTKHRVYIFFIVFIKSFEYYYVYFLIISDCIFINPMICIFVILGENLLK